MMQQCPLQADRAIPHPLRAPPCPRFLNWKPELSFYLEPGIYLTEESCKIHWGHP